MNIDLQFVSSCPFDGGASRAAFRLHDALIDLGFNSRWLDAGGASIPVRPDVMAWSKPNKKKKSVWMRLAGHVDTRRYTRPFSGANTYASWPEGWGKGRLFEGLPTPSLWHLHWVSEFLDWPSALPLLSRRAPVIWTLHDLNPMQGVWHYDPYAEELNPQRDALDVKAREIKRNALLETQNSRLVFIAPSKWIAKRCRDSELLSRYEVVCIPNGIDCDIFHPVDKHLARSSLCLPPEVPVVGFLAANWADPRKGMKVLHQAMQQLSVSRRVTFLAVGNDNAVIPFDSDITRLGRVTEDTLLRLFYSACDVFVCPSIQDNLPNTVLEAMACGTPVIASSVGGIPDMVHNELTGWLVPPGSAEALASKISEVLASSICLSAAGRCSRERALADFSLRKQAIRHAELYQRVVMMRDVR